MAVGAMILSSCSTDTKDSYSMINFGEHNLITDKDNPSAPAQVASSIYKMKINYSKQCIDLSTSDMEIDDRKVSFETDTVAYQPVFLVSDGGAYLEMGYFSKKSNIGKGAEITNLSGFFTPGVYNVSNLYVPEFETTAGGTGIRLVMGYDLDERYHLQTFWPLSFYMGETHVFGTESYNTKNTAYRVELNFKKNTARMAIYYPEFSKENKDVPQAIVLEDIPITFDHDRYHLESAAPKTRILGKNDKGVAALVESEQYKATDFSFYITSTDLTEATISYKIDGKSVNFTGCSIVKANKKP